MSNIIAGYVAKYIATTGTKKGELAIKAHMNYNTLNYKLRNPDRFTRGELVKLFKVMKLTDEERLECMK